MELDKHYLQLQDETTIVEPFPHVIFSSFYNDGDAGMLREWLETSTEWKLQKIDNFYELYEVNFKDVPLPQNMRWLISREHLADVSELMSKRFGCFFKEQIDVSAHRLIHGQRVGIHTDSGPRGQTHRLLVHFTKDWFPQQGGFLILLEDRHPASRSEKQKYYLPKYNTAFAFEISARSFHAVSEVKEGLRYAVCYSFYKS